MNKNLVSLILCVAIVVYNVCFAEPPIVTTEYNEHIYKIFIIEQYALNLLLNNEKNILEESSISENELIRFKNTLKNLQDIIKEHLNIKPSTKLQEFHELATIILKTQTDVFEDIVKGLETKDTDLIAKALNTYAGKNINPLVKEFMEVANQLSAEIDGYTIQHIEEKIGRKIKRGISE